MGAKIFSPPDPIRYGSSAQQAVHQESSSDSVQCIQPCYYRYIQTMPKKSFMKLQAVQENISNGYSQNIKEKTSHEYVETIKEGHFHKNIQTIQNKPFMKLQTIQEDISNENSESLKEESSRKYVQAVKEHSFVQIVKKKPLKKLQAIQEDILNGNFQALKEGSSHEHVQAEEGKSFHRNDQSVQEEFFYEKVETTQKKFSHTTDQNEEEKCSHGNVQTMNEKSSRGGNDQLIQEELSHENFKTTQKSVNGNVQTVEKAFFHDYVQAVEEGSSNRNDQSVQEKHSYEKLKTEQEESSHDQDEEEGSFNGNINIVEEGSRNNESVQEEFSHENVEAAQEKSCHRNIQTSEGSSHRNDQIAQEEFSQENRRCCTWLQKISIEPTMWLYMMAFMFTSVVEQDFFLYKACRVDHGYSEETCLHLKDYKDIKTEVQKTVSEFQQWYNFAGHIMPIILALFFGNWSDRRGRKLPLIIGLTGKLAYSLMIIVNSLMKDWNLNMVTYTAVIPMGILGGDVMIFGSCFAYLTDICSLEERTIRITILDAIYLSTMPMGIALGSYVFAVVNSSYTIMFAINASLLLLAIVYSLVRLKWQTTPQQQSLVGVNFLKDFFDINHVRETLNMMTKSRPNKGRLCLILIMLAMCLYTFQREERAMSYLYTQLVFNWDVTKFSNFRTFQSSLFVIAMLCVMPLLKYFKLKDTIITIIGATSHALGRLVFIAANKGRIFYTGAVVAAFGPVVAPALRSMASKFVQVEERGKVFAILSVFDNAVPLISSIFYSQLYNATILTVPNFIYWLTFITQICVILLAIIISFARGMYAQ